MTTNKKNNLVHLDHVPWVMTNNDDDTGDQV